MSGTKRDLFGFGKKVVRIAIEDQATQDLNRHQFLGNQFGGVQNIEAKCFGLFFGKHLHTKLPLGVCARLNAVPQVAAVKVWVGARNFHGLVPHQAVRSCLWAPVEFAKNRFTFRVDQLKTVHAKALHGGVAARNGAVAHLPHQHVG